MAKEKPSNKEPQKRIPVWMLAALLLLLALGSVFILRETKKTPIPSSDRISPGVSQPGEGGLSEMGQTGGSLETDGEALSADAAKKKGLPEVTNAKLELVNQGQTLTVTAGGSDPDNDPVTFTYAWEINEKPAGDGNSISGFKRGDHIKVKITPFDGKDYGRTKALTLEITNIPPKITELKELSSDGKTISYQVKAEDPDGDPLSYSLLEAPQGMTINNSGLILLTVSEGASVKQRAKVKVSDNHGGQATADFEVNLGEAAPK